MLSFWRGGVSWLVKYCTQHLRVATLAKNFFGVHAGGAKKTAQEDTVPATTQAPAAQTQTRGIRCGHCKGYHASVYLVRTCSLTYR